MFSRRTSWDRTENGLTRALREAEVARTTLFDLTESNPSRAQILDLAPFIAELGHPRGAAYEPAATGHAVAKHAVSAYYAGR
ncbi:MAG TPA: pyridoxal phosphate-dependent aminotransferase, partial [Polyangiaceae bacterium]|nr:pyridoxal phosphate-dependent aminotransferase [Polyangiaceae bacterium]